MMMTDLNRTKRKHRGVIHFCIPPGEDSGGFSFTVTDGQHTTPLYQFVVTARPLTITMVTQEELVVFPGNTETSDIYFIPNVRKNS